MPIHRMRSILIITAQLAAFVACSTVDSSTELTSPTGTTSEPPATAVVQPRGFLWSPEKGFEELPLPANTEQLVVTAMNNAGIVVGFVTRKMGEEEYRAFRASTAKDLEQLGSLVGPDGVSIALAIDDAGKVKGLSEGPATEYNGPMGIQLNDLFIWDSVSGMRVANRDEASPYRSIQSGGRLVLPGGMNCLEFRSSSRNGYAVGYAGTWIGGGINPSSEAAHCSRSVAVMWSIDGQPTVVGECAGVPWCAVDVRAVNNNGEVVGNRESGAFRWSLSKGFAALTMKDASVYQINDRGDVAGAVGRGNKLTPFVWMATGETRMISLPAGGSYGSPVAINERGQVAGNFQ